MTDAQEPARAALRSALERFDIAYLAQGSFVWGCNAQVKALAEAVRACLKEESMSLPSQAATGPRDEGRAHSAKAGSGKGHGENPTGTPAMPQGLFNLIDHVAKCLVLMREELMKERQPRSVQKSDLRRQIKLARQAVTELRDATREGLCLDFRRRDPLVMAIHNALDLVEAAALRGASPHPPDFWRCRTCGCLWRDNHDNTVSLGSVKQTSCPDCEMKGSAEACEPLFRTAPHPPSTVEPLNEAESQAIIKWLADARDSVSEKWTKELDTLIARVALKPSVDIYKAAWPDGSIHRERWLLHVWHCVPPDVLSRACIRAKEDTDPHYLMFMEPEGYQPKADFTCWICGKPEPHAHSQIEVDAARKTLEVFHDNVWSHLCEAQAAASSHPPATSWQPIATAPKDEECLFWLMPKTPEEAYCNTSGDPIFGTFEPYVFKGKLKCWSSLSKATHWLPLPPGPTK